MTEILLVLAGAVVALVTTVLFQEPLQRLLARLLGGIGPLRGSSLKGNWASRYSYFSQGRQEIIQVMQLRQFGPFVVGRSLQSSGPHKHFLHGRLRNGIFTGQWHNVADKAHHHGAFQFLLTPDGQGMEGKWVGFDKRHQIQHGNWTWKALPGDLSEGEMRMLVGGTE